MTLVIRRATRDDIDNFFGKDKVPFSLTATIALEDDEPIAMGGLVHARGRVWAFLDLREPARKYKMQIYKTIKKTLNDAKEAGHRYIFVNCDLNEALSPKLLAKFGFRPLQDGTGLWRWEAK